MQTEVIYVLLIILHVMKNFKKGVLLTLFIFIIIHIFTSNQIRIKIPTYAYFLDKINTSR